MKHLNLLNLNLSKPAAVGILAIAILWPAVSRAQVSQPVVGAMRWDAWAEDSTVLTTVTTALSPNRYHWRVPFFGQVTGTDSVYIEGNTQAIMDQEIAYAANAGLNYWAFDIYPDANTMTHSLHLYLRSAYKNRINFAALLQSSWITNLSSAVSGDWTNVQIPRYVSFFTNSSYQKVLGNQPLLYVYMTGAMEGSSFPTAASVANAFTGLRVATTNAGLAGPYIVFLEADLSASQANTYRISYGGDAIGFYAYAPPASSGASPYSSMVTSVEALWNTFSAQGTSCKMVPLVSCGWDNRTRYDCGGCAAWDPGTTNYYIPPTTTELAGHLTDGLGYLATNCFYTPANAILMYGWNEHDEGGWFCPTLNTNTGGIDTSRLDAINAALALNTPRVYVGNQSFEFPGVKTSAGTGRYYYTVPAGGTPSTFVWSNNFAVGDLIMASVAAGNFSATADGSQVLELNQGKYIWQDTGPTAPDTLYTLRFSLLWGKGTGGTNSTGAVTAQLLDGASVLASNLFAVPATSNTWGAYTLSATSPHSPTNNLIIKFTGVTNTPWLDKVWLTAKVGPPLVTLTNASFENPIGSPWWTTTLPASFGWANNLGTYVLANSGAGHFSAAADGSQAVQMANNAYVQQDTGLTAADTAYSLFFTILQDKTGGASYTNAALQAQVLDGASVLASNRFTVPSTSNVWQSFTLTANSPHKPVGDLVIKLMGTSNSPWLDNVALSARSTLTPASVLNGTFESPLVNTGGWYTNGTGLLSAAALGWSNNLGTNVLASRDAGRFSIAGDGAQALLLQSTNYISQDTGPTPPDTFYSLSFNLLQDKAAPNANSILRAQLFDGTNQLATTNCTVPATPDSWQPYTLLARSPAVPVGDFIIKFSGVSNAPWLDSISLASLSLRSSATLTNYSFEIPTITNYGWWTSSIPASFGWSNNILAGDYALGNASSSRFSAPADGSQALRLIGNRYVSQDAGSTVADTYYSLSFNLLQDMSVADPTGTVKVQLLDGGNVLATGNFTVPAISNVWQTYTLAATAPHVPAGHLVITFTNVSGNPWLDYVQLATTAPLAPYITSQPQTQTAECGSTPTLTVGAGGTLPLRYQWYLGGSAVAGGTNSSLVLTNVHAPQQGSYTVVITNTIGTTTSGPPAVLTVVDTTPPMITMLGANPLTNACPTFVDPGATATDACAGSLTVTTNSTVTGTPGIYTIKYSATDSSGNSATNTRTVYILTDTTPPAITLNGSNPMTVECHSAYSEPGASANDTCAGSVAVRTSGSVNANTPGTYTVTYSADDGNGNTNQVNRTVNVVDTTPPVITLNGSNPMTLPFQGTYAEPGALASDACAGGVAVQISGSVNASVPGPYQVAYTATDGYNSVTNIRTVNVQDTYTNAVLSKGPLAWWRLNELGDPSSGTLVAADSAGAFNGTYGSAARNGFNGIAGPCPPAFPGLESANTSLQCGPTNSWVTLPALNLNTNTVTFTMWIYSTGSGAAGPGLLFNRGGVNNAGAGLGITGSGLYYDWNNNSSSIYNWASYLVPPSNQWSFVALAVGPTQATIHLYYANPNTGALSLLKATNVTTHSNETFSGTVRIGNDPYLDSRTFAGSIDEVTVFSRTLSVNEIENLFATGLGQLGFAPRITQQPASPAVALGQTAQMSVLADGSTPLGYQWQARARSAGSGPFTNLVDGGKYAGSGTPALTISNVVFADVLDYVAVAANSFGSTTSSLATVQLSGSVAISLTNGSFEIPAVDPGGWYTNGTGLLPYSFGWSNNLGTYVLASSGAGHFSTAADGAQAVALSNGKFVQQDTGLTASNTFYNLAFRLLLDKATPNFNGSNGPSVQALILNGTNVLAASDFAVSFTNDYWATYNLTAISPLAPTGHLIIKFTGVTTNTPWLDNVTLTATPNPVPVSGTNFSFEIPTVTNWWSTAPLPASFGWSNNLSAYTLGSSGSGHYSVAADGVQALLLNNNQYIQQTNGPTVADTVYALTCSVLQDNGKYTASTTNGLWYAQVFDGPNLLASKTNRVPSATNDWNAFTLMATAPHVPAGNLVIKFGGPGNTAGSWMDKVSLTALPNYQMPPGFTAPLLSQTAQLSSNVTFSVSASGTTPLSYQWYSNSIAIPGATGTSITLNNVGFAQSGKSFSVVISNLYGTATAGPATLTVVDTIAPTITTCATNRTLLIGGCVAILPDMTSEVVATDTSGSVTVTQTPPGGTALGPGITNITLRATDSSGNSSSCTAVVTVADNSPPVVTLLGSNPLTAECHAVFTDPGATATDNCSASLTTNSTVIPNSVGTYTIQYIATDPSGNAATNTRTVYVVDTTPPAIACPGDVSVVTTGPTGTNVSFTVTATDACDPNPSVVSTPASGSFFPVGTNTVVCVATDVSGHTNGCSFRVMVDRAPVASNSVASVVENQPLVCLTAKLLGHASDPDGDPLSVQSVISPSTNGGSVLLTLTNTVVYQPVMDFVGQDQFSYVVSDGRGGTATANVFVTVVSSNGPSANLAYGPFAIDGQFVVRFAGVPGCTYTVEASPTLTPAAWGKRTNLLAPNLGDPHPYGVGIFEFRESIGTGTNSYYRTVYPSY